MKGRKKKKLLNEDAKTKSKLLNRKGKKKLLNEDAKTKSKWLNGNRRRNTKNERERMKWNLSCKKYALEQKLIAREPDEIANDYGEVKKILLKRYKLTPEKFRQKFFMHNKNLGSTWKNFAYKLRSFFNEWVNGVKADCFEKLSDLIITDQIKRKVSQEIKDNFIDEWFKQNSPDDLVEKLDDDDTSTFRSKQPRKEWHYDKQNSFKDDSAFTTNGNKKKTVRYYT
ncbi:hypothetical protein AVEN_128907-1 [Araneus ventricosus]|uniref:SCAN box domain-containing protein n=1 Tax=Araneus ventricosus TaxID=182803 RepID=A0A4Y2SRC8_ARAVE|nr:hypothetical protein AVEN_128907-1 [Araneus ventricosus]